MRATSAPAPIAGKASAHSIGTYLSVAAVPAHRMRQPTHLLEIVVGPVFELGDRVLGKESRASSACR